jgi:hypothetical protein
LISPQEQLQFNFYENFNKLLFSSNISNIDLNIFNKFNFNKFIINQLDATYKLMNNGH